MTVHPKYHVAEGGVLAVGTKNVSTEFNSDSIHDSFEDGTFMAAFHRLFWDFDENMGYFMVFVGGSTKDQASNDPHDFVEIPGQGVASGNSHKPWDVALYLYQDFWKDASDPARKANFMIGGTVGPDNPQFMQYHFFMNVEAFGLIKSRPHDRMGAGWWWNGLSDNFKDLAEVAGDDLRDPWGFEFYYNYELTPWSHLTADLQLVENQDNDDDFAIIPGVRMVVDF